MQSRIFNKVLKLLPKLNDIETIKKNSLIISTMSISSLNLNQLLIPNRSNFNLIQSDNNKEELDIMKRFKIHYNNEFKTHFEKLNKRGFFSNVFLDPVSKKYDERKLIGYSPEQMFKVVADVDKYHEFVPWCVKSTVKNKNGSNYLEAELEVGFQVFVERYISKITYEEPNVLYTKTYESTLFNHLESRWKFDKGPTPGSCWLSFHVDFAFKSPLYKHVAAVFFEEVVKQMMGAFIGRCKYYYGPSSLDTLANRNKSFKVA